MIRRAVVACALASALAGCKKSEPPPAPAKPAPPAEAANGLHAVTAQLLGTNLLTNGDAEAAVEGNPMPGWSTPADSVGWDEGDYGSTSGEFDSEHPPFPGAGKRYFRCSTQAEKHCRSVQRFSLDGLGADVDQGKLKVDLAGWFGSFGENDASAILEVRMLGASGKEVARGATEPSKHAERAKPASGEAAMSKKTATMDVPAGTRVMEVALRDAGPADAHADAYFADNLEVHLRKAP